jgi:hypothetical protein
MTDTTAMSEAEYKDFRSARAARMEKTYLRRRWRRNRKTSLLIFYPRYTAYLCWLWIGQKMRFSDTAEKVRLLEQELIRKIKTEKYLKDRVEWLKKNSITGKI